MKLISFGTPFSTVTCLHSINAWFGILEWNKNFIGVTGEIVRGIFHLSHLRRKPRNFPSIMRNPHDKKKKNYLMYWNDILIGYA